jgi:hypothetical protein
MTDDDIDRILSATCPVSPSSAFTASVMAAVRAEAATPSPLPFPWTHALPGLMAGCAVLIALPIAAARGASGPEVPPLPFADTALALASTLGPEAAWILAASLLMLATVGFSLRLLAANPYTSRY